ncbi:MAG: hypothetical protein AAB767_04195 [Patescibacteria group bacterium]
MASNSDQHIGRVPSPFVPTPAQVADELYYDAMEMLDGSIRAAKQAAPLLLKALKLDPAYVQTHIGLSHVYGNMKRKEKAREHILTAYEQTRKEFPKWPKRMVWGDIDNRAYMRAIQYRADLHTDDGEKEQAIELHRLLLALNPNDNQGVRYTLAGLYAGISGEEINRMFDEGNEKQDWDALELLVQEQNKRHHFWKGPKWTKPRGRRPS